MNEKTNAQGAGGGADARGCGRAEQLIAYLYGESSPEEAADFRRHVAGCAACGEEVATFGGVRAGLGEWREEVMRSMPALKVAERLAHAAPFGDGARLDAGAPAHAAPSDGARARKRSAAAALREFFSLSPLWLKVGTAAAALAFCALAALTLARAEVRWGPDGLAFNTGFRERVVERQAQTHTPTPEGFTREQVDALVRQSVEREVAAARGRWEAENAARAGGPDAGFVNAGGERRASSARNAVVANAAAGQRVPRRPSRGVARGEQLADKEDVFYPGEESVPRLTDILGAVKPQSKENER
jgi:hypothetical protein